MTHSPSKLAIPQHCISSIHKRNAAYLIQKKHEESQDYKSIWIQLQTSFWGLLGSSIHFFLFISIISKRCLGLLAMNPESCCLIGGHNTSCKHPRGTLDNPGTIARCLQLYQSKEGGSDGQCKALEEGRNR